MAYISRTNHHILTRYDYTLVGDDFSYGSIVKRKGEWNWLNFRFYQKCMSSFVYKYFSYFNESFVNYS